MTSPYGAGTRPDGFKMPAVAPAGLERTRLVSPETVDEACRLLAEAEASGQAASVLAGGTDFVVDRHLMDVSRAKALDLVVDVTGIRSLTEIETKRSGDETRLVLGGGVTYWALRNDARVTAAIPMLGRMARDVGAVQIQTRGTLAGNLATASPAADGVAALMALDARVILASARGEREVPVQDFFTGYRKTVMARGELIRAVDVRVPTAGARVQWQKVGTRLAQAISKVALASAIELESGKIARARFGMASVGPVTAALPGVAKLLVGRTLESLRREEIDAAVAGEVHPIDDVRSTGHYRLRVAKALVWRALAG